MFKRAWARIVGFFSDVQQELKKVSYPTRTETMGSTMVVVVFVMLVGIFLAVVDLALVRLVRFVIQ
jgi:preprotein translocase subunit SecE